MMQSNSNQICRNVVWQPIKGSSQELAVNTPVDQTLYCGTRWSGKTVAQLMYFRRFVGRGWGDLWKGVIFEVEYKPLEDIITQAKRLFLTLSDGCRWVGGSSYWFIWPGGEKLLFRAVKKPDDATDYLGHGYSFVGYNELSKWGTSEIYDYLLGSMRAPKLPTGEKIPTRIFTTTNPWGPGTPWIKKRFIDPTAGRYGRIIRRPIKVTAYGGEEVTVEQGSVALMGNFIENPHIPPEKLANLWESVRHYPARRRAWLYCDWNVVYDEGALGAHWRTEKHVVDNHDIPPNWKINRAMDWGSTHPCAIAWFAESNGEEFTWQGKTYCYPAGTVIMFYEWYMTEELHTNRGQRKTAYEIADGVKLREKQMRDAGIIQGKVRPGPADNQISNVNEASTPTYEKMMASRGVRWTKSDKSAGTRVQGLGIICQRLQNSLNNEGEGLYFQRRCKAAIELLPALQGEGEDIRKNPPQEDHIYDMLRYRLLDKPRGVPNVKFRLR